MCTGRWKSLKFSFLFKRANCLIGSNCCQTSWSDRLMSFTSKKMSAKYSRLHDYNMSICLPRKKAVSWGKKQLVQSAAQTFVWILFLLKTTNVVCMQQKCFRSASSIAAWNIKMMWTWGLRFFTAPSRIFLSETETFSVGAQKWKRKMKTTAQCHGLDFC